MWDDDETRLVCFWNESVKTHKGSNSEAKTFFMWWKRAKIKTFQMYVEAYTSVSSMKIMLYELFRKFVSSLMRVFHLILMQNFFLTPFSVSSPLELASRGFFFGLNCCAIKVFNWKCMKSEFNTMAYVGFTSCWMMMWIFAISLIPCCRLNFFEVGWSESGEIWKI